MNETATGDIRIDEMMPVLSEAWPVVPFEDCLIPSSEPYRKLKSKEIMTSGRIPVVDQGEKFIAGYTDEPASEYRGTLPVIIFGDHTRRFKFIDFEFAVGADGTQLLHPFTALVPKFFYHYLSALNLESQGYSRHYKFLKQALVPIPPLAEQHRIVAKLERLLGQVDSCKKRLAKIPAVLKRFRQSVLAAACSGRLTVDWREKNGVSIEEGWRDAELRDICSSITDGDHLPPPKRASGIPFLTIGNISSGRLDFSETRFVPESYFASIKPERLPKRGDTLFTVVGATIGIPVLVDTDRAFCFQRHIAILKPSKETTPKFLHMLMGNPTVFREAWERVTGTAQPTLPLGNLRSIPINIPSLPEQQEIVRRVEKLLAVADQIEARFTEAKRRVDNITQSLLAKAFRGELVPTEYELARAEGRSFESAEELLERIKGNGEESSKKKAKRSGKPDSHI